MQGLAQNRRGQQVGTIQSIGLFAVTIMVAVIIIGLSAQILQSFENDFDDDTAFFDNETLTWAGNNTAIGLTEGRNVLGTEKVYFNGTLINKGGNYTIVLGSITFINASKIWNGTDGNTHLPNQIITDKINVSYTYNIGSASRNITRFGIAAQVTLASFVPTIAIIVVASIVIGVIFVFFGRRRRPEE